MPRGFPTSIAVVVQLAFAGCSGDMSTEDLAVAPEDAAPHVTPERTYDHTQQPTGTERLVQLLTFDDAQPLEGLRVCPMAADGSSVVDSCVEVDEQGYALFPWTAAHEQHGVVGEADDGTRFTLAGLADYNPWEPAGHYQRVLRPTQVLTTESMHAYYKAAMSTVVEARHLVLAHARLIGDVDNPTLPDMKFELRSVDAQGVELAATYPDEAGQPDDSLEASSSHGHGTFLDVPPGTYELHASSASVACSSLLITLDGNIHQFVAPEIICE